MTIRWMWIVAVASAFMAGSLSAPAAQPDTSQAVRDDAAQLMIVVDAYVVRTRGWPRASYDLRYLETRNGKIYFAVDYLAPSHNGRVDYTGDDGMSFVAVVDPVTRQVEKTLCFQ